MSTATTGTAGPVVVHDDGVTRYLTFRLNGEVFAIDIAHVTEILELRRLTPVPMMPASVRGVINLRGRVVPIVDLAVRFGRGTTTIARRTSTVIVSIRHHDGTAQDVGVLVDSAHEVLPLAADDIEPPPSFGAGIRTDFLAGMAHVGDELVVLLDAPQVLDLDELARLRDDVPVPEATP